MRGNCVSVASGIRGMRAVAHPGMARESYVLDMDNCYIVKTSIKYIFDISVNYIWTKRNTPISTTPFVLEFWQCKPVTVSGQVNC